MANCLLISDYYLGLFWFSALGVLKGATHWKDSTEVVIWFHWISRLLTLPYSMESSTGTVVLNETTYFGTHGASSGSLHHFSLATL